MALSPQEATIMDALCEGYTMSGVARLLGRSISTVSTHSARSRRKLGARSILQAVSIWTALKIKALGDRKAAD